MALWTIQLSTAPGLLDFPFMNNTGSDIAAGLAVVVDSTNALSSSNTVDGVSVKLPAADGALGVGVTMEVIKAGNFGRVRTGGQAAGTASGAITAGAAVMVESATGKIKASGAGNAQIGIALTTAADGDPVLVQIVPAKNA